MRRLLVVACSACKNKIDGLLPAIERYDGPVFRVLRKYLREESTGVADVLILSAKFGLISANKLIPNYDLKMSEAVAATIRPLVLVKLRKALALTYQEIGFCLGCDYLRVVEGFDMTASETTKVTFIRGGLGLRLTHLRAWLRDETNARSSRSATCDAI